MTLEASTRARLDELVRSHPVVLFMKGVRGAPQCGFSAAVVDTLDRYLPAYVTIDVLRDQALRENIKLYSQWPTIPQLYVNGEFVGGCDIVREMDAAGELTALFGSIAAESSEVAATEAVSPPSINLSSAAAAAIREALDDDSDGLALRLSVDENYYSELSLEPKAPGDISVSSQGVEIIVDRESARRADGISIDFVTQGGESGFRVDNPNAPKLASRPSEVRNISVEQLKSELDAGAGFEFIDVRSEGERRIACVAGSKILDHQERERLAGLPKDTRLVFMCHHGGRSLRAAQEFVSMGFSRVDNVVGGIDAWSQRIDSSVAQY